MASRLSITDQNGKTKQVQVYDKSELQQYDEAELIVHISSLQSVLGPEMCPATPRLDSTRDELISRVLDLQRRALRTCEVALDQEASKLLKVGEAIKRTQNLSVKEVQVREGAQWSPIPSHAIPSHPSTFDVFNKEGAVGDESPARAVQIRGMQESASPSLAEILKAQKLSGECRLEIQKERQAREEACSSLAQQWRNALAEEKEARETFQKKVASAIERCDKLMKEDHVSMTQMKSDYTMQISDLMRTLKSEVQSIEKPLHQLAMRSADEFNSLRTSIQELQSSNEAQISDILKVVNDVKSEHSATMVSIGEVRSASRDEIQNIEKLLQQLTNRSGGEVRSLWSNVHQLHKKGEAETTARFASMKQVKDMVAQEFQQHKQAILGEAREREANEKQLQATWRAQSLETQKVLEDAERWMIECGVALQDDFNMERQRIVQQMCELMKGLQQTCKTCSQAFNQVGDLQGANPGSWNVLVRELGNVSNRLVEKSNELIDSEAWMEGSGHRTQGSNFDRFTKLLDSRPKAAATWNSEVYRGASLGSGRSAQHVSRSHIGDGSKRLEAGDLLPGLSNRVNMFTT